MVGQTLLTVWLFKAATDPVLKLQTALKLSVFAESFKSLHPTRHSSSLMLSFGHSLTVCSVPDCMICCVCLPAARLAETHTAAVSGAVGPFDAARYFLDVADGAEPHEPRPGCSEPENNSSLLF